MPPRKPSTASKADSPAAKRKTTARKSKVAPVTKVASIPANRTEQGRFSKGKSGNPSGRPKEIKEVRDLARQHTKAAIARLAELMLDDNGRTAVAACTALLDRAWGKAPQSMELPADGEGQTAMMPILHVSYG